MTLCFHRRPWRRGAGWFACGVLCVAACQLRAANRPAGPHWKTLPGHIPSVTSQLAPSGVLNTNESLSLAIGLPLRNSAGLETLLAEMYNPASPHYRQFLTPAQFTEQFGPTTDDYAAVLDFARKNHLAVTGTNNNRLLVDVSGSVGDIQRAFRLKLRTYHHPHEARDFYAPDTEPTVDAQLPILDVSGLNNYVLPHPQIVKQSAGASSLAQAYGSAPGGGFLGRDLRAAYLPGVSLTGSGQSVGLLQFDGYYASDIAAYETAASLTPVPVQPVLLDGYDGIPTTGADSGNDEVSLDIEMAMSIAPGLSKIFVFEAGPNGAPNDILNAMVSSNQVKQFSSSWGWGGGPSATTDNIFKEMAAQGQSFFQASGDSDAFTSGQVDSASQGDTPSSSPYITVVGGTTLTTTGPGGSWVSETVWNAGGGEGSSGGISSHYSIPNWQATIPMTANAGSTSFRNIPDVAWIANNVYVRYGNGTSGNFGGTSCAAPCWAGLAALINQQSTSLGRAPVGFVNPALYTLGQGANYNSVFHDITTGNNEWSGSPNEFSAVAGYDLCTGWGTPAGQNLIDAIAGPADALMISPSSGFTASGPAGGPFSTDSATLTLTNTGTSSLTWSIGNLPDWLIAAPTSGSLASGASANLAFSLSNDASTLAAGNYGAAVVISNLNSGAAQTAAFAVQVGQSIVQNGGFETGDFSDWQLDGDSISGTGSGSTIYNAVESNASGYQAAHSGNYGAFLGDTKLATLSQNLATVSGQVYLLSFWLDNPTNGSGQFFLANWIGGNGNTNTLCDFSNPPAFAWTNLQFLVTSPGSNAVIQFAAQNDPYGFGLDDVSVTPVPAVGFQSGTLTNGTFNLNWRTAPGLVYQVQYKSNLTDPVWLNLGVPVTATTNELSIQDSAAAGAPQRFYRLTVSVP